MWLKQSRETISTILVNNPPLGSSFQRGRICRKFNIKKHTAVITNYKVPHNHIPNVSEPKYGP